jgi:predicted HicB family RNase H-like nuclease
MALTKFTFRLDPIVTNKASKKAKHGGLNLSLVIRQYLKGYVKGFKEEETKQQ